jgi:hypothetical protein
MSCWKGDWGLYILMSGLGFVYIDDIALVDNGLYIWMGNTAWRWRLF